MRLFITVILYFITAPAFCQEVNTVESQLEPGVEAGAAESGDDEQALETDRLVRHPIDLNKATAKDLELLQVFTPVQIGRIIRYRTLMGPYLSVFELQAAAGCDAELLRKAKPWLITGAEKSSVRSIRGEMKAADQRLVIRYVRMLERAAGYVADSAGKVFAGDPAQWQVRYLSRFKKSWQAGWLAEKDAGESMHNGQRFRGFDFYSFHLFARDRGVFHALVAGDYTASMGQGLIQWQGMGAGRSSEVMMIVKRDEVLKPYQSAGESSFFRGTGMTLSKRGNSLTLFCSSRKKDANLIHDSTGQVTGFSSWNTSGLHRTAAENADRHVLHEMAAGMVLSRQWKTWKFSLNGIGYRFSLPLQKRDEPYNIYAIHGRNWYNASLSWSGNARNLYLFGEMAADRNGEKAIMTGMVLSADPKADISVLYRNISPEYAAVSGGAFTAATQPVNEEGLYLGLSLRPAMGWTLGLYADLYRSPWLKYNVDGPSVGSEYFLEARYVPDKLLELYSRIRFNGSEENAANSGSLPFLVRKSRVSWRTHAGYKLSRDLMIRGRVELTGAGTGGTGRDRGFLWFSDLLYKPLGKPFSVVVRVAFFDTDSYDARVYAYENDILYSYALPGFSGRGFRGYLLMTADAGRKLKFWLRLGRLQEEGVGGFGTGPEKIRGSHRTDLKLEARWLF